jgi:hypothetical protein
VLATVFAGCWLVGWWPTAFALPFAAVFYAVALLGGATRRGTAKVLRTGVERPLWLAAVVGVVAVRWTLGPIVALATIGGGAALYSFGVALSALRLREPIGPVKSSPEERFAAKVAGRWDLAAERADWVHPDDPEVLLRPLAPPRPNGLGGVVVEVEPPAIDSDPEHLRTGATAARRALHAAFLFVQPPAGGRIDTARIHLYEGYPLAAAVPWRWPSKHARARAGEWVPVGPTAAAEPAWVRPRLCTLIGGVTDSGKGGVQLAIIRGLVAARVPVALLLVDNKGTEGGREYVRLADVAAGYVQASADAWPLIRACVDLIGYRFREVLADGEKLAPSAEHPLVWLCVAELWSMLQSRPPRHVRADCPASADAPGRRATCTCDWSRWTGGRLEKRPDVGEWRAMIDEAMTTIAREGQAAGVAWCGGVQAAQMEAFGKGSRLRTVTPARILLRVLADDDVEPILGTTAVRPPAELIPEDQPGTGYLRVGTGNPVMFRAVHIPPRDVDRALVQPLRKLGAKDWAQRVKPFIVDGNRQAA